MKFSANKEKRHSAPMRLTEFFNSLKKSWIQKIKCLKPILGINPETIMKRVALERNAPKLVYLITTPQTCHAKTFPDHGQLKLKILLYIKNSPPPLKNRSIRSMPVLIFLALLNQHVGLPKLQPIILPAYQIFRAIDISRIYHIRRQKLRLIDAGVHLVTTPRKNFA